MCINQKVRPTIDTARHLVCFFTVLVLTTDFLTRCNPHRQGLPSGDALIEFVNEENLKLALGRNRRPMGNRIIHIRKADTKEVQTAQKVYAKEKDDGVFILRLRGLPQMIEESEIIAFFAPIKTATNGLFVVKISGVSTGEAFVQFNSEEDRAKGLKMNKDEIREHSIKVDKSGLLDIQRAVAVAKVGLRSPLYVCHLTKSSLIPQLTLISCSC